MNKKKYTLKNIAIYYIPIIILAIIGLKELYEWDTIWIINDEYGYWGNAAYMAGYQWNDIFGNIPFFSYGYSFLLAPIMYFILSPGLAYKSAIIMNVILIILSYVISIKVGRKLFKSTKDEIIIIFAFLIHLYPNLQIQAKVAWSEVLLVAVYWLIIYILIKVIEQPSNINLVLLIALNIYIMMIHQRSISVVIMTLLLLLLLLWNRTLSKRKLLFSVVGFVIGIFIFVAIKEVVVFHTSSVQDGIQTNTFAAQESKIRTFFTMSGFKYFISSFISKLFYLGTSTFLIFYYAMYKMIICLYKNLHKLIKREKIYTEEYIYLYILGVMFITMSMTAVHFLTASRYDVVVYGRYNDSVVLPVIMIGLYEIYKNKFRITKIVEIMCIYIISAWQTNILWGELDNTYLNAICSVGIFQSFAKREGILYLAFYIAITTVFIIMIYSVFMNYNWKALEKYKIIITCSLIACSWVGQNNFFVENSLLPSQNKAKSRVEALHYLDFDDIYLIENENDEYEEQLQFSIMYMQFRYPEKRIDKVDISQVQEYDNNDIYLIERDSAYVSSIEETLLLVGENEIFYIYQ